MRKVGFFDGLISMGLIKTSRNVGGWIANLDRYKFLHIFITYQGR